MVKALWRQRHPQGRQSKSERSKMRNIGVLKVKTDSRKPKTTTITTTDCLLWPPRTSLFGLSLLRNPISSPGKMAKSLFFLCNGYVNVQLYRRDTCWHRVHLLPRWTIFTSLQPIIERNWTRGKDKSPRAGNYLYYYFLPRKHIVMGCTTPHDLKERMDDLL